MSLLAPSLVSRSTACAPLEATRSRPGTREAKRGRESELEKCVRMLGNRHLVCFLSRDDVLRMRAVSFTCCRLIPEPGPLPPPAPLDLGSALALARERIRSTLDASLARVVRVANVADAARALRTQPSTPANATPLPTRPQPRAVLAPPAVTMPATRPATQPTTSRVARSGLAAPAAAGSGGDADAAQTAGGSRLARRGVRMNAAVGLVRVTDGRLRSERNAEQHNRRTPSSETTATAQRSGGLRSAWANLSRLWARGSYR